MTFSLSDNFRDDVVDVRDIIARVEELREDIQNAWFSWADDTENDGHEVAGNCDGFEKFLRGGEYDGEEEADYEAAKDTLDSDDLAEVLALETFLKQMAGYGGDEEWEGDWYPVTLILDDYFEQYAQDYAEEVDLIKSDTQWPYTCIDWKQAAAELKQDYSAVTLTNTDGEEAEYQYR